MQGTVINLPEWKLTLCPPLYDTSSRSPIEQTAQVYAKMRELVEAYNQFATDVTKVLSDYIANTNGDIDEFKKLITCMLQEHINAVDIKIAEEFEAIKEYIVKTIDESLIRYNEENEEVVVGGV